MLFYRRDAVGDFDNVTATGSAALQPICFYITFPFFTLYHLQASSLSPPSPLACVQHTP